MNKLILTLLLLILPAFAWLTQPGYFSMHDDLQTVRQMELDKCFKDLQIPCRWVLDLGYGFGYPLFNFYPQLPYLIGLPFRIINLAYIDIVKIVGILGFVFCAYSMFLLGSELWGKKGGLISSLIYTFAPYHSVDYYVRGAMNEFWAMAFFPAIFYTSYQLIRKPKSKWIVLLALSVSGLMLSHNLMLLIFTPLLIIWCLFWIWNQNSNIFTVLVNLSISAFWAFGLSAFFTLPVIFESKFAHVETLTIGYFNFLAHFLDLKQIFLRINWGYGESLYGPNDTMSFALGYLQWIVPLIVLVFLFIHKKLTSDRKIVFLLVIFLIASLFFSHYKSTPIWLKITPLQFLQFPWRFLTIAVFSASLIAGAITKVINKSLLIFTIILTLILNANYFRPRVWYPNMTDEQKFSGDSWRWQVTGSIFDYLPIYAPLPPKDPAGGNLGITSGIGTYQTISKKTNYQEYQIHITSDTATVEIQTFYFPGWKVYLNNQLVDVDPKRDPLLGRMQIDVKKGDHELIAKFTNTPIRTVSNTISLLSWLILIISVTKYFLWKSKPHLAI